MNKPFIHIATDEKFIDDAYKTYEQAFPGKNLFVILIDSPKSEIKHISSSIPYLFIYTSQNYLDKIGEIIYDAQYIIFHSFTDHMASIFSKFKTQNIKKVWTLFGSELHENPYVPQKRLYGSLTYNQYVRNPITYVKNIFRPLYYKIYKSRPDPYLKRIKSIAEIDFVAVMYKEEFDYFKIQGYLKNAEHMKFTYIPIGIAIDPDLHFVSKNNILFGNSASYTNNHLEGLNLISKLKIGDKKLIVPLSYGKKEYAKDIIEHGKKLFGSQFHPLTNFLPKEEYHQIISQCGVLIMNHYRQQALGNVIYNLYAGAKVYLSEKNTLYHYLKRIGCDIFSIEADLVPENKKVFELLTREQMQINRRILYQELNIDRICNELRQKLPL